MEEYQARFSEFLADSRALFFEKKFLRDGRPTPYFVNLGAAINNASHAERLSDAYASMIAGRIEKGLRVTTLFGPAYKGISLAIGAQSSLWREHGINLGVVYDRKEAKDHGEGGMFIGDFPENAGVYLIDDVITSAQTKEDSLRKIRDYSKNENRNDISVVGCGIAFDRQQKNLAGEDAIKSFTERTRVSVDSIVGAKETIRYLFELGHPLIINGLRQRMDTKTYDNFQRYMETYGT
ncbi:hypothetical protein HY449_01530 [Candidatus Pacearchaeota archaeon]|nr:hypothetical protein [Candidatus Pacearchaeota archaeon]